MCSFVRITMQVIFYTKRQTVYKCIQQFVTEFQLNFETDLLFSIFAFSETCFVITKFLLPLFSVAFDISTFRDHIEIHERSRAYCYIFARPQNKTM